MTVVVRVSPDADAKAVIDTGDGDGVEETTGDRVKIEHDGVGLRLTWVL